MVLNAPVFWVKHFDSIMISSCCWWSPGDLLAVSWSPWWSPVLPCWSPVLSWCSLHGLLLSRSLALLSWWSPGLGRRPGLSGGSARRGWQHGIYSDKTQMATSCDLCFSETIQARSHAIAIATRCPNGNLLLWSFAVRGSVRYLRC